MISWQTAVGTIRRCAPLRRAPTAAVCLFVAVLLPSPVDGSAVLQIPLATTPTKGLDPFQVTSDADGVIEGTVVLGASNPFTFPDLAAHAIRILAGRFHVASADPLGRLERWELSGAVEGTLHSVALAVAHPAPRGPADAVRVLTTPPGFADPATRREAVHLGVDVRAWIPGVAGWLRADRGIDPVDGASAISAAWVSGGPS